MSDIPRATSIPGKWEAVIAPMKPPVKAFSSSSLRFDANVSDVPGPGSYSGICSPMICQSPSHSKKGYGNSFASKSEKGMKIQVSSAPGPGHYQLKGMDHVDMSKPMSAFVPSGRGRVPYPDPALTKAMLPGPLDYHPKEYHPPLLARKESATFVSKSKRDSFMCRENGVPEPGKYSVNAGKTEEIPAFLWSRSTYRRFQNMGFDNKVPGPGAYFDQTKQREQEESSLRNNLRACGVNRNIQYLGKLNDKPISAIHTFGADKDRFKHSFMGRLDLKAEIPGVGTYSIPAFTDTIRPVTSTTAKIPPFNSSGPRLMSVEKGGVPGPAYYKPKKPNLRPVTHNFDQRWM